MGGAAAQTADAEPNTTVAADSPEAARSQVAENVSAMRAALAAENVSDDRSG